ncbi:hypothetical protein CHELA40_11906 [Chelatococcus asaccharovorans]|nr:hypothetical protein CHELA40_11906 [Chelatococcus asaccharovorans]
MPEAPATVVAARHPVDVAAEGGEVRMAVRPGIEADEEADHRGGGPVQDDGRIDDDMLVPAGGWPRVAGDELAQAGALVADGRAVAAGAHVGMGMRCRAGGAQWTPPHLEHPVFGETIDPAVVLAAADGVAVGMERAGDLAFGLERLDAGDEGVEFGHGGVSLRLIAGKPSALPRPAAYPKIGGDETARVMTVDGPLVDSGIVHRGPDQRRKGFRHRPPWRSGNGPGAGRHATAPVPPSRHPSFALSVPPPVMAGLVSANPMGLPSPIGVSGTSPVVTGKGRLADGGCLRRGGKSGRITRPAAARSRASARWPGC